MFSTKIVLTALVASTIIAACAINAKAQEASNAKSYIEVLRDCGSKWRGRDDKTEKGGPAWQAFRAMCVKDSGFVAKRSK